jgi:hypothetical protein
MQASLQHSPAELSHAFGHPHGPPTTTSLLPSAPFQYRLSSSPPLLNAAPVADAGAIGGHNHSANGVALLPAPSHPHPHSHSHSHPHPHSHSLSGSGSTSKRKDVDGAPPSISRKRKRPEGADPADEGPNGGPKHWTDDEKTRLFNWVMGPGRDLQFNSLRASKNGCLREVRRDRLVDHPLCDGV